MATFVYQLLLMALFHSTAYMANFPLPPLNQHIVLLSFDPILVEFRQILTFSKDVSSQFMEITIENGQTHPGGVKF